MDGSETSLAGIQVEFFCRLMRTGTPFIDSLVLSFFENIRMVMSAKIELCVIRQILLNLIFLMTDYKLDLLPVFIGGRNQELTGQNFYPRRSH